MSLVFSPSFPHTRQDVSGKLTDVNPTRLVFLHPKHRGMEWTHKTTTNRSEIRHNRSGR